LKVYQAPILGAALVCFIFVSGLTDAFVLYGKIPGLLLVITAVVIGWQKEKENRKTLK